MGVLGIVGDVVEVWRASPREGRVAVFLLALACGALAGAVSLFGRANAFGRVTLVTLSLCVVHVAWLCTAPRADVIENSGFSASSKLSRLRSLRAEDVEECANTSSTEVTSDSRRVCVRSCLSGGGCYPRVRRFCVSRRGASACAPETHGADARADVEWDVHAEGKTLKLTVRYRDCAQSADYGARAKHRIKWYHGTSILLDSLLQPPKSGHIYHELEKLLAGLHLTGALLDINESTQRKVSTMVDSEFDTLRRARVFWFASRASLSTITRSVIDAVSLKSKVVLDFIAIDSVHKYDEWCFEDAVLIRSGFGSLTPGQTATNALRRAIMPPCGLDPSITPVTHATSPQRVLIFDRAPPRSFVNTQSLVKHVRSAVEHVDVRIASSSLTTCEQVKIVSTADAIVTPHGSQHALFLFAKPGATIVEVQPYLYFNPEDTLFLLRSGLRFRVHESMGLPHFTTSLTHRIFVNFGWRECMSSHACRGRTRKVSVIANVTDVLEFFRRDDD
jgi:hypothetical protein